MKKRSRELSIFSMSALDLFASALGAFILITIVLLPFFPNLNMSGQEKAELEQAQAELEQAKAELEQAEAELEQAKAKSEREKAKLEREKAKLEQEKAKLEQAKAKAPKTESQLEKRVKALQKELERAKAKAPKAKGQLEKRVEALQKEIDDTTVLLGIKTKAKKFVFVIDMSGSIYQPGQQDYRQFITLSIQDMLAAFKSEIEVCLIGFQGSNQLHYWPQNRGYFQVKKNTRDRVVGQVKNWMKLVDGGTPTRAALLAAIALDPEEIILLSDGAPSEDWHMVVRAVTTENRRKIPIHAVAVGNYVADRKFIDFLVQLTERNNGYVVGAKPG